MNTTTPLEPLRLHVTPKVFNRCRNSCRISCYIWTRQRLLICLGCLLAAGFMGRRAPTGGEAMATYHGGSPDAVRAQHGALAAWPKQVVRTKKPPIFFVPKNTPILTKFYLKPPRTVWGVFW